MCNCLPKPAIIWLIAFEQISGDMATEHINGNGTEEPMDTTAAVTHSDHFNTLLEAGLPQKVAEKLDEIYLAGKPKLGPFQIDSSSFLVSHSMHVELYVSYVFLRRELAGN